MSIHKKQKLVLIGLIILLATFLRFYRIQERAPFLGDQGRDLLEVRETLLAGKIPLVSQPTSQNFRTGPAYYYLLIPSLISTQFHPLGPILFFTSMGVLTSLLIFSLSLKLFGFIPALISALVYATSPLMIQQTLGFWNPIPVPLFVILILFSLYQVQKKNKLYWLLLLGFFVGISAQLHLSTLVLLPFILFWWLYFLIKKTASAKRKAVLVWTISASLAFLLTFVPFFIFQFQNNFNDFKIFFSIIFEKTTNFSGKLEAHYFSFLWVFPFFLLAFFLKTIKNQKIVFILGSILILFNLKTYVTGFSVRNDLTRAEKVSTFIIQKAENKPFAILLLSDKSPSDAHFRYFLKLKGANVKSTRDRAVSALFLICTRNVCPAAKDVHGLKVVETECLPYCPPLEKEKTIDLTNWQFVSDEAVFDSQIYLFQNPNQSNE